MAENKNPQWPINNDDKKIIQDLGRKLHKFILDYAKENAVNGTFHAKLMSGGFQYVEYVMGAKAQLIADDILFLQDSIERFSLGDAIIEPFAQTPTPSLEAMKEEAMKKREEADKELTAIEEAMKPVDVEAAPEKAVDTPNAESSPAPSSAPVLSPIQPSGDSPTTA